MSYASALKNKNYSLQKVWGYDVSNQLIYSYVLCLAFLAEKMKSAISEINLTQFGIIILQGYGSPTAETDKKALEILERDYKRK